MGINANTVRLEDLGPLSDRVRERAARVMDPKKASALADALAQVQGQGTGTSKGGGNRLAYDAAAKLLSSGKLRQAEKAYTELVAKHGDVASFVGLARTQAALEDEPAALTTLREGASRYAKQGDRATAISLLAEAVGLAPSDLAGHRRLAAALANQGDLPGAVEEYGRFVDVALSAGDSRRALLELAYGRETLGDLPGLLVLVDRVTGVHTRADGPQPPKRAQVAPPLRITPAAVAPSAAAPAAAAPTAWVAPELGTAEDPRLAALAGRPAFAPPPVAQAPAPAAAKTAAPAAAKAATPTPWIVADPVVAAPKPAAKSTGPLTARTNPEAASAVVMKGATTLTHAERVDLDTPVDVLARIGVVKKMQPARPKLDIEEQLALLMTTGSGIEAATGAASRASLLTGAHDPRATEAVLDAARRLLALGKLQSASDVLLDFIGHGFTDREAQRLLIEVDCALGRRDVAKEKCTLLSHAYRLDGRADVAEDVERLARIL
jgi:hypothetical protein